MDTVLKHEYDIEKDNFAIAGEASSNIKKILSKLGLDAKLIRSIAVATYEAEINIIIHSDGGKITLNIMPEYIQIIAKDIGPGIENIELALKQGYSTATNKIRTMGFGAGMGLPNIKRFCDEFTIDSEKGKSTTLNMKFYLENH